MMNDKIKMSISQSGKAILIKSATNEDSDLIKETLSEGDYEIYMAKGEEKLKHFIVFKINGKTLCFELK